MKEEAIKMESIKDE